MTLRVGIICLVTIGRAFKACRSPRGEGCRYRRAVIPFALFLLLCWNTCTAQESGTTFDRSHFAHLPDEQIALAEELFENYFQLKAFYQSASISVHEEAFGQPGNEDDLPIAVPPQDLVLTRVVDWEYRSRDGDYFRLDGKRFDLRDRSKVLDMRTGIIRPDESFYFHYNPSTKKYYLKAHGKNREEYFGVLHSYGFPVAPFAFGPLLLEYIIFSPTVRTTVTSISIDETGGDSKDAIATVMTRTIGDNGSTVARIELLRNRHWAVKRIESDSKTNTDAGEVISHIVHECDYEGEIDAFPLLKRVTFETHSGYAHDDGLRIRRRQVFDVASVTAGGADRKVFDVSRLMPKLEQIGEETEPARYRWLLVSNGVVLLILGILLSRRRRRNKDTA